MRAFRRLRGAGVELVAFDLPEPSPVGDEIALRVEAAWLPLRDDGADEVAAGAAAIGTVVAAGDGGAHLVGTRVLITAPLPCGECEVCRRGGVAACPRGRHLGRDAHGCLAEQVVARARWATPLEGGLELSAVDGALVAGPLAEAYALFARAGVSPGDTVAIVGDDATAAALVRIAAARGVHAARLGADDDLAAARDRIAALRPAGASDRRPLRILDSGDDPRGLALALLEPAATVALLRRPGTATLSVDLVAVAAAGATLLGVAGPHPDLIAELAALVVKGELATADLAEEVAWSTLPALDDAGERARQGGRALIVSRG